MFTTQDTYCKKESVPINELECSFMGNQLPPMTFLFELIETDYKENQSLKVGFFFCNPLTDGVLPRRAPIF